MILKKSLSSIGRGSWLKLTGVLALLAGLAIFTGAEGGSRAQAQKYTFQVVVYKGLAYPEAWRDLVRGIREADEVYPDLEVIYSETDDLGEFSDLVMRAIAAAIAAKTDGLIVTTTDPPSPLYLAIGRGIPVITIGVVPEWVRRHLCFGEYGYRGVGCIGEDPYLAGVMAAEESLKRFTPKFAAAVFEDDSASRERTYGFSSTILGKGVEVGDFPVMDIDLLLARLREFRGQDTLVFITAPSFTERFIQRAKEFGIELGPGGVRLVQVGVYPKAIEYIEKDKIMLTAIDQQWYLQGHLSVDGMYSYVKYGMRRPWVTTQEVVTEETIKSARELGAPLDDPLGLLLAEAKGQPIRVVSNPCLCLPNPSFEISDATKKDELAKYFKDLPKAPPPARALCGGFGIFNPALDRRLPFSYAHVASGVIKVPERVGKKIEYVYYKDKHGLEKWLKDLYKQSTSSQLKEPLYEDEQRCRKEIDKPIEWGLPRSIHVSRSLFSGRPNPSFEISDPAEIDKLAEFFKDLPMTTKPARALWGGFLIFTGCLDPRLPGYTHVASGIIKIGETYYKDIHGLEKWLEELCKRSTCDPACASIRTSSHHEPESTSLPAQQLPTSGAEPPYNDELWNELPYSPLELGRYLEGKATIDDRWVLVKHRALEVIQRNNNCYNYADNIVTDTLAQPGRLGGVVIPEAYWVEDGKKIDGSPGDHTLAELCKKLEEATKADGLTVIDCAKVCPPSKPGGKPDSYKEMLFVGSYDAPLGADRDGDRAMDRKWRDYHFYRQDKGGSWSHKPGKTEVTNRDASRNSITDPRRADRKYEGLEYTEFCGCFCRGPNVAKK
jgi:DNA-binding LacI/PurR family transcriptional regulator